jgi:23S rRNA pseudouridine1911/1915/1917 synthase
MIPEILYEDNHIIIVNKPPGVLSQGDASGKESLLEILKKYIKSKYNKEGNVFIGLVHRLDMPVSGVMVFARTSKAARRLFTEITTGSMEKYYAAVVEKNLPEDNQWYRMENFLYREKDITRITVEVKNKSQKAVLYYRTILNSEGKSLVLIRLETGKKHQIRAQFSGIGAPIAGDKKYGSADKMDAISLHAVFISFKHPTLNNRIEFYSEIPGRFKKLITFDSEIIKNRISAIISDSKISP